MFNCACTEPDFYFSAMTTKIVKARKEHECCECHCAIKPGDKYERVKAIGEGDFFSYATCLTCVAIANDFMSCGRVYMNLWENLRYVLDSNDPDTPDFDWLSSK